MDSVPQLGLYQIVLLNDRHIITCKLMFIYKAYKKV